MSVYTYTIHTHKHTHNIHIKEQNLIFFLKIFSMSSNCSGTRDPKTGLHFLDLRFVWFSITYLKNVIFSKQKLDGILKNQTT